MSIYSVFSSVFSRFSCLLRLYMCGDISLLHLFTQHVDCQSDRFIETACTVFMHELLDSGAHDFSV